MKPAEHLRFAFKSLWSRKLRSALTIVGISIGIALYIVLLSQTQGLYDTIVGQIQRMGVNNVFVLSLRRDTALSVVDLSNIRSIGGVAEVIPLIRGDVALTVGDKTLYASVIGMDFTEIDKAFPGIATYDGEIPSSPSFFVALAGYRVAFPPNSESGDPIVRSGDNALLRARVGSGTQAIDTYRYLTISAVLSQYGVSYGAAGVDSAVIVPLEVASFLFNKRGTYDGAIVVAEDVSFVTDVSNSIAEVLGDRFTTVSPEQIVQTAGSILAQVQLFLGGMAAISLLVSGVGIANIMYISVMERVKIIGLYKALGMKKADIATLYLVESSLIGLMGGFLGILMGVAISAFGINLLPVNIPRTAGARMPSFVTLSAAPTFNLELFITSMALALLVSTIAGIYPAYRASQLEPAQALRSE